MSLRSTMLSNSISRGLVAIGAGVLIAGCDQTTAPRSGQDSDGLSTLAARTAGSPIAELLASGFEGGLGSTVDDYTRLCPGATINEGLAVRGEEVRDARADVVTWLRNSGLLSG